MDNNDENNIALEPQSEAPAQNNSEEQVSVETPVDETPNPALDIDNSPDPDLPVEPAEPGNNEEDTAQVEATEYEQEPSPPEKITAVVAHAESTPPPDYNEPNVERSSKGISISEAPKAAQKPTEAPKASKKPKKAHEESKPKEPHSDPPSFGYTNKGYADDNQAGSSSGSKSEEGPSSSSSYPQKLLDKTKNVFKSKDEEPTGGKTIVDMSEAAEAREPREQYDNLFQYLLACIGFAVGLGNVWRFPKVALENGGGAFIIPWIIVIIIQGIPLMMVELVVGQRFRGGPMHSYGRMNKFCWGIGLSMGLGSLYVSLFYNSILSYAFMYFFNSFSKDLPWLSCPTNNSDCTSNPAQFYFENSIVNSAPDLETGSGVVWPLYFATVVAWFVVFLAMLVGVQSVGKVIYFTALYPYLMLTILFFIGVTSDGAEHGLEYLFEPDWSKLGDFTVWQAASEQVFFSASLGFGGLIAMASYMPVKNNTFRDSIVIIVVNSLTSLYAALGIFSIKGHMAKDEWTKCHSNETPNCDPSLTIRDYVKQDDASAGLVFIAMAKALDLIDNTEYGASVLSMMFYLMIITLGLDSAFGSLEGYLSILKDLGVTKKFGYKLTLFACCFASGLFAMLFSSVHGSFFIDIFDKYGSVLVLVFMGLFEFIAVGWIYGFNNFARDFKLLTDMKLPWPFMILIKFIGPLSILITLIGQFVLEIKDDKFLTYLDDNTPYPWWAQIIALLLFFSAVIWFPLGILITCYINRVRKTFGWGEVDFDYEELIKDIKPSKNPRWQQIIFSLDEYDYPENLELLSDNPKLVRRFPNNAAALDINTDTKF